MAKQGYETPNDGYQEPLPGIYDETEEQQPSVSESPLPKIPITVEVKEDKPLNPAHLTTEQIEDLTKHDDQFTPMQNARRAGIDYIPSSPPDSARLPEKPHTPYGDRRHLSSAGKATADGLPKHEDLLTRQGRGGELAEAERLEGAEQARKMFDKLNSPKSDDS